MGRRGEGGSVQDPGLMSTCCLLKAALEQVDVLEQNDSFSPLLHQEHCGPWKIREVGCLKTREGPGSK